MELRVQPASASSTRAQAGGLSRATWQAWRVPDVVLNTRECHPSRQVYHHSRPGIRELDARAGGAVEYGRTRAERFCQRVKVYGMRITQTNRKKLSAYTQDHKGWGIKRVDSRWFISVALESSPERQRKITSHDKRVLHLLNTIGFVERAAATHPCPS